MTKRTIIAVLALFTGAAFADPWMPPCLVCTNEQFSPNGVVTITGIKTETGNINGIYYNIFYEDGSGSFGHKDDLHNDNWNVECKKDKITDSKMCSMKKESLYVYAHGNGKSIVSIGHDHFPNSSVTIRIESNTPITTSAANDGDFPAKTSDGIITKLKRSKSATTRYMEWPYRTWVDKEVDTQGFNEAYAYIKWAVKHIK
jgi:hypothetical protein